MEMLLASGMQGPTRMHQNSIARVKLSSEVHQSGIVKLIGESLVLATYKDDLIKTLSFVAVLGLQALDEFHVLLLRILRLHILVHDFLPRVSFRLALPGGTWSVSMSHIHGSHMPTLRSNMPGCSDCSNGGS